MTEVTTIGVDLAKSVIQIHGVDASGVIVIRHAKRRGMTDPWLANIIADKPTKVAAVALANKNARIAWALLRQGGTYQKPGTGSVA